MTKREAKYWIRMRIRERKWFDDHGGCLAAYVERYGSADNPTLVARQLYGNGGEAIYAADKAALENAERMAAIADRNVENRF